MEVVTWQDELNNRGNRFFLHEKDCQEDIEEWRRVGFKQIGKVITYHHHTLHLPSSKDIIQYLAAWYINRRIDEFSGKDIEDIVILYIILQTKIPQLECVKKLKLGTFLKNLNQTIIQEKFAQMEQHNYLLDFFIDCYSLFIVMTNIKEDVTDIHD